MRIAAFLAAPVVVAAFLFTAGTAAAAEACVPLPAAPTVSADTPAQVVKDYSASVQAHIDCLRRDVDARRDSLSRAEKETLAAQLSRATYAERKLRVEYATLTRTAALSDAARGQVAALER